MKTRKLVLFAAAVVLAALACQVERVFNPSLPTHTPTSAVPEAPAATPTPTPIPTPEPGARIGTGDEAYFNGNWERALQEYAQALELTTEDEVKAAAMLGIGRTYLKTGQVQAALDTLNEATTLYPDTNSLGPIYFTLGVVHETLGQPVEAAEAFLRYQQLRPGLIDAYLYEQIGDNHLEAQNYQAAIDSYILALQAPSSGDKLYLNLRIADTYMALNDPSTALVTYQDIYSRTANDFQKAEVRRKMADIWMEQGDTEQAYPAYREVVENYPLAYDAYLSLVALLDANQEVSELNRGLINYFVQQYGFAVDAFVRYLRANPETHNDTAHYYLGLSYRNQGNYPEAIAAWREIIDEHVNDRNWANAFDEIGYTQAYFQDQPDAAIQTYLDFVDRSPLDERSPEFLYYAGRVAERDFQLDYAARLWERLGTQFSTSTYAFEGLFQAGIARYRIGEYQKAVELWQSALGVSSESGNQAAAYFWIGKGYQRLNQNEAANDAWLQASTSDPTGYYSERAEDLLAGRVVFAQPQAYSLNVDLEAERATAVEWVKTNFSLPPETNLDDSSILFSDPRMVRGAELWHLGQFEAARLEFESVRQSVQDDVVKTFLLAEYLIDIGLYRSGVIAARQVLNLAGMDDAGTFNAPRYFNHLRFGLYYREIVVPTAEEYGFHPLFVFSVMRQESLFEGFVTSTAGARGLMQIVPATGEEISRYLNWPPNYSEEDLYRPLVNIPFGVSYLDRQRDALGGDLYAALAAYNGGPGNAATWRPLAEGDQDLFVEVIRFEETRNYIRYIYELYEIYVGLYGME